MSNCNVEVPNSLRDCTVCLTGYTGYVGSHVLRSLSNAGITTALISRPHRQAQPSSAGKVITWSTAADLAQELAAIRNPVFLNIAGHFVSQHSPDDISPLVAGNFTFPLQIFEAIVRSGHTRIVNIGTTWEYSDAGDPNPVNFYAQLKSANASSLTSLAKSADLQVINLKLNDTYGGADERNKLLPMIKKKIRCSETITLGFSAQKVNFTHIVDVQRSLFYAAELTQDVKMGVAETAFLLSDETISLGELAKLVERVANPEHPIRFKNCESDAKQLRGVWNEAPKLIDFKCEIDLQTGITDYLGVEK